MAAVKLTEAGREALCDPVTADTYIGWDLNRAL